MASKDRTHSIITKIVCYIYWFDMRLANFVYGETSNTIALNWRIKGGIGLVVTAILLPVFKSLNILAAFEYLTIIELLSIIVISVSIMYFVDKIINLHYSAMFDIFENFDSQKKFLLDTMIVITISIAIFILIYSKPVVTD